MKHAALAVLPPPRRPRVLAGHLHAFGALLADACSSITSPRLSLPGARLHTPGGHHGRSPHSTPPTPASAASRKASPRQQWCSLPAVFALDRADEALHIGPCPLTRFSAGAPLPNQGR
jgi:hypothetical protein